MTFYTHGSNLLSAFALVSSAVGAATAFAQSTVTIQKITDGPENRAVHETSVAAAMIEIDQVEGPDPALLAMWQESDTPTGNEFEQEVHEGVQYAIGQLKENAHGHLYIDWNVKGAFPIPDDCDGSNTEHAEPSVTAVTDFLSGAEPGFIGAAVAFCPADPFAFVSPTGPNDDVFDPSLRFGDCIVRNPRLGGIERNLLGDYVFMLARNPLGDCGAANQVLLRRTDDSGATWGS